MRNYADGASLKYFMRARWKARESLRDLAPDRPAHGGYARGRGCGLCKYVAVQLPESERAGGTHHKTEAIQIGMPLVQTQLAPNQQVPRELFRLKLQDHTLLKHSGPPSCRIPPNLTHRQIHLTRFEVGYKNLYWPRKLRQLLGKHTRT